MINIYLDIETIPSQSPEYRAMVRENIKPPGNIKLQKSIDKWLAENGDKATDEAVAKTSFDPAAGHVCCIGWAIEDAEPVCSEVRDIKDEAAAIDKFFRALPEIGLPRFVGHYVAQFDIRFLLCRAIVLGVKLPPIFPKDAKPWDEQIFDTMTAWAGAKGKISLDNLASALGLSGKGDFDGSMVADAWANGEYDRISKYCISDVELVREVHRKFLAVGY